MDRGKRISDSRRREIRRLVGLGCTTLQVATRMRVSPSFVLGIIKEAPARTAKRSSTGR